MSKKGQSLCFLCSTCYQWFCRASKFSLVPSMKRSYEHRNSRETGQLFLAQGHWADWSTAAFKALSSAQSCFGRAVVQGFLCLHRLWGSHSMPCNRHLSPHTLVAFVFSQHSTRHTAWLGSVCIPQPRSWRKYRPSKYSLGTFDKIWIKVRQVLVCINMMVLLNQWP